jgi:transcriptional regulator with XRE-family HTH domain
MNRRLLATASLGYATVAPEAEDDVSVLAMHTQELRKMRWGCQRINGADSHTQSAYVPGQSGERAPVSDKPVSDVAKALKRLRRKAGISIPRMAMELGMKAPSTYQHYEDKYKKSNLPIDIAVRIAGILRNAGISDEELEELGAAAAVHNDKQDQILNELRELRERFDALAATIERE